MSLFPTGFFRNPDHVDRLENLHIVIIPNYPVIWITIIVLFNEDEVMKTRRKPTKLFIGHFHFS